PSQLSETIRARPIQSAGACRAPASLRIFTASPSSRGTRARKNFGTELASRQPGRCSPPQINHAKRNVALVLRSLKGVDEPAAQASRRGWRSSPDPGLGLLVELGGGVAGDVGDVVGGCERDPGQGVAPEDPPPGFLQVEPAGADGDEGVVDPLVAC